MAHFWYNLRNRFVKAYNSGYLPEQDGHKIFFQEIGNPKGQPVICFHGGPGSGARVSYAYSYNLKKYRVIILTKEDVVYQNTRKLLKTIPSRKLPKMPTDYWITYKLKQRWLWQGVLGVPLVLYSFLRPIQSE